MKIIINYSSKMSNSFSDENKKPNVVSLESLTKKKEGEKVIINENDNYEDIMHKIQNAHPNFKYNPIVKNTVLGIVSRLLGEIRYLDLFLETEKDHIINKLKDKITFELFDRNIFNEIIRIETPEKDVQNNGGGLISKKNSKKILLNKNKYSELIYSVLNINNIEDVNDFIDKINVSKNTNEVFEYLSKNNFEYNGTFEIFNFIKKYNENIKSFKIDNEYRKYQKGKIEKTDNIIFYENLLKKMGKVNYSDETYYFNSKFINMGGILCYTITQFLIKIGEKENIDNLLIDQKSNKIKGIAPNSGGITLREIYYYFAPKKSSFNSPFYIESKYFDKKENKKISKGAFNLGITKEDGILEINIDIDEDLALKLKNQILNVGVSTFQLGKKGLAYVDEIRIYD